MVFDLKAPRRNPVIPCTRALHLSLWQRVLARGWCGRRCCTDSLVYQHELNSTGPCSREGGLGTRVAGEAASRVEMVTLPEGQRYLAATSSPKNWESFAVFSPTLNAPTVGGCLFHSRSRTGADTSSRTISSQSRGVKPSRSQESRALLPGSFASRALRV